MYKYIECVFGFGWVWGFCDGCGVFGIIVMFLYLQRYCSTCLCVTLAIALKLPLLLMLWCTVQYIWTKRPTAMGPQKYKNETQEFVDFRGNFYVNYFLCVPRHGLGE